MYPRDITLGAEFLTPKILRKKKELFFASRQLNSIEINGSFYSYQKPSTYQRWFSQTPEYFVFSLKEPKYITHALRLKDPKQPFNPLTMSFDSPPIRTHKIFVNFNNDLKVKAPQDAQTLMSFLQIKSG